MEATIPIPVSKGDAAATSSKPANKLVLCFDGTSNKFNATERDSNIVKIYEMLDRTTSDQFHYYQPGIGTYEPGELSNTKEKGFFGNQKANLTSTFDEMFGTSFVHHVIAGYQFILKYYAPGDKIYIFGFSRGAYTARFLSEMIDNVGLLSMGNDEMIQFAWDTFSDYQRLPGSVNLKDMKEPLDLTKDDLPPTSENHHINATEHEIPANSHSTDSQTHHHADPNLPTHFSPNPLPSIKENYGLPGSANLYNHGADRDNSDEDAKPKTKQEAYNFMQTFKSTFCRPGVRVYMLCLFDCVNSVATFNSTKNMSPYLLRAPARHIRHALSLHERRAMFRPSLFLIDTKQKKNVKDTFKEVWFAGNHGDVGGGWWLTDDAKKAPEHYLISDIPLKWMVSEIILLEQEHTSKLCWHQEKVQWLTRHAYSQQKSWSNEALSKFTKESLHDCLKRGEGLTNFQVWYWRMMELLPFSRFEYLKGAEQDPWVSKWFPPNYGASRDIPHDAKFHSSVFTLADLGFIPKQYAVYEDKGFWLFRLFTFIRKKELASVNEGKHSLMDSKHRVEDLYMA